MMSSYNIAITGLNNQDQCFNSITIVKKIAEREGELDLHRCNWLLGFEQPSQ